MYQSKGKVKVRRTIRGVIRTYTEIDNSSLSSFRHAAVKFENLFTKKGLFSFLQPRHFFSVQQKREQEIDRNWNSGAAMEVKLAPHF